MDVQVTLYSLPLAVAAVLTAWLAVVGWRRRHDDPVAVPFAVTMLALCEWSLASVAQLSSHSLATQFFWEHVGFVGAVVAPTSWFVLALVYSGRERLVTRRTLALLTVEPLVTLALVGTSAWHDLIWTEVGLITAGDVSIITMGFGRWYYVNLAYSYLLVVVAISLLTFVFLREARLLKKQAGVMVVGSVVPLAANVLYQSRLSPVSELDVTPFAFAVTGLVFALALFKFRMLDLGPVARRELVQQLGDGMVVIDANDCVVDANRAACQILDHTLTVGTNAADIFPCADVSSLDGRLFEAAVDGTPHWYDLQSNPLYDHRGHLAGQFVAMRDVTDRREYEQRLEVANRVMRHNLRNDMNVILGLSEHLSGELPPVHAPTVDTIHDTAVDVVRLAEKARYLEQTLDLRNDQPTPVELIDIVSEHVSAVAARYPAATIELTTPSAVCATVADADLFGVAVENVLENACEHSDRDCPTVHVTVESTHEHVRVTVADDGPGIPSMELEPLIRGSETPLSHGSGMGLWLVQWTINASGGSLTFDTNEPRGSIVTLCLKAAQPAD